MIEIYVELRDSNLTLTTEVPFNACSESFKRIFDVWGLFSVVAMGLFGERMLNSC